MQEQEQFTEFQAQKAKERKEEAVHSAGNLKGQNTLLKRDNMGLQEQVQVSTRSAPQNHGPQCIACNVCDCVRVWRGD